MLISYMKITFTEIEFKNLVKLARGRHYLKDIVMPDRDIERWNNTQAECDLVGVMGEYAVAKVLRIPVDTEVNLSGDGGETDLHLGDWSIQVKSTKYISGRLVFNTLDEMRSLIYVLTVCNIVSKSVDIIGYISNKDMMKNLYTKDLGFGVRYCIDQKHLKDISWLTFYFLEWYYPSSGGRSSDPLRPNE